MFVEDIKNDFYNILLGNRVLLLVHYDVDAICTCKILQDLFKCDNISYTLVPIGGISELKTAYEENNEEIKYVVLVNCGGTIDLVDILQPEEEVVFFVIDSHKPTDICNVYSDGQVRLIYKDDEENIPNFDDIFRDDEDDDEPDEELQRTDRLEAVVNKRREKKAWEERRHTLMFNYTQFSYYGKPSACVALELAVRASRCAPAALWAAAVACTAHSALHLRASARCLLDAEPLHRYLATHSHAEGARVVVEKDLCIPLYRCWSVESALSHARCLAPALRLHAASGPARLRQLLADMGFPLQQARQAYRSMDVELRRCLLPALEAAAPRHGLAPPARAAFLLHRPHAHALAALDTVLAVMALIEHETLSKADGFQKALAGLQINGDNESLKFGILSAKRSVEAVSRLSNGILSSRSVMLAGPFNYFIVQEGVSEASSVRGPLWLGEVARWVASAGGGARPLLASAPSRSSSHCLLLGVPPRHDTEPRNLFGAAFEQAATRSGVSVSLDYVDTSVVLLPTSQRTQFLDALTALLA